MQGTINGYGERTGNCSLTSVVPILELKLGKRGVPSRSLPKLKELSEFVDEIANMVTWLASEENSFTTGGVFDLSGGRATY